MKQTNDKFDIELSLSSISWQLKRIADSLEIITDELQTKDKSIQSSKLLDLIKNSQK